MSLEQTPGRERPIQPLDAALTKRFARMMDLFNPEPKNQPATPLDVSAAAFYLRAGLTLSDLHTLDMGALNNIETQMWIAADKGNDPVIPVLELSDVSVKGDRKTERPRNSLTNVTLGQIVELGTDIVLLKRQEFDYHPERLESLWESVAVIAEDKKGKEFGEAVRRQHKKAREYQRKEFRNQLGLPV